MIKDGKFHTEYEAFGRAIELANQYDCEIGVWDDGEDEDGRRWLVKIPLERRDAAACVSTASAVAVPGVEY